MTSTSLGRHAGGRRNTLPSDRQRDHRTANPCCAMIPPLLCHTGQSNSGGQSASGALNAVAFNCLQRVVHGPQGYNKKCQVFQQELSRQDGDSKAADIRQEDTWC